MNAPAPRFASVDVLRGLAVAAMLLVNDPGDWSHVPAWLEHAAWNGCTFADYEATGRCDPAATGCINGRSER